MQGASLGRDLRRSRTLLVQDEGECQIRRMTVSVVFGVVAFALAAFIGMPPSRELMLKLGTLLDWARRENPQLYAAQLEPISPFVGKSFKHARLKGILRADLTGFGEICQRLQREAKRLDVKAHYGLIPIAVYALGLAVWYAAR